VARADDQVVTVEVELLDGDGERAAGSGGSGCASGSRWTNECPDAAPLDRAETEPGRWSSVKSSASGKSSHSASSTFSPPRMPVSQS
jgi:hypothetical protein